MTESEESRRGGRAPDPPSDTSPSTESEESRRGGRPPDPPSKTSPSDRQLVIFSAFSARPSIVDLVGLLMCGAEVTGMGGTARVSVVVADAWRVHCLAAEFMARRLSYGWKEHTGGKFWVRTSYSTALKTLTAPSFLDGHRLRLWYIAAGSIEDGAAVLGLSNNQALARPALAPLGLDGSIERGPAIRIEGAGKLARLADLIGERPPAAPVSAWPG